VKLSAALTGRSPAVREGVLSSPWSGNDSLGSLLILITPEFKPQRSYLKPEHMGGWNALPDGQASDPFGDVPAGKKRGIIPTKEDAPLFINCIKLQLKAQPLHSPPLQRLLSA
jgi:hypothetical protein